LDDLLVKIFTVTLGSKFAMKRSLQIPVPPHLKVLIAKYYAICNDLSTANFVMSVTVKVFRKSVNIWQRYEQGFGVVFLTQGVVILLLGMYTYTQFLSDTAIYKPSLL